MSLKYVQTNTFYQAGSGVIIGATSIVLTSLTDIYGNVLTMTDFGSKGYGTCEPDTTNEESFTFTGVTTNANGTYTLTGVSTALAKSPYTETSGTVRAHAGGSKVVVSDTTAFWNTFGNKNNNETVTGVWGTANAPTNANDFTNKAYVDGVAIAGAPNASTTVKGIVEEATQAEVLAKTAVGGTGADLYITPPTLASTLLSDYKVDTGVADAYAIAPSPAITAYTTGQIFSFKAVNANTTTSTLNVNGLGVKTIKNAAGGNLTANNILAGQIVVVEYDGTNFQLISTIGNGLPAISSSVINEVVMTTDGTAFAFGRPFDYQLFTGNGTWTKPTNLSGNEAVIVEAWGGGGAGGGVNSTTGQGGAGGGGAYITKIFRASDLGSTVTVTIGATATGGTGAGPDGNNTTFGSLLTAYGGGGGEAGSGGTQKANGGGGGLLAKGATGSGTTGGAGGGPLGGAGGATGIDSGFGGGGGANAGGAGGNSAYGGGGGGAGNSVYGGGGGGVNGGAGGTSVFAGAGGTSSTTTNGTAGSTPAGGGGSGGRSSGGSSNGGNGARGEIRIWTIY